ncbi:uncharacterized protein LOC144344244, partial [Saccoglossus kowalevskii]
MACSRHEDYIDVIARVRQLYSRLEGDARRGTSYLRDVQVSIGSTCNEDIESILTHVYKMLAPQNFKRTIDFRHSSKELVLRQLRELLSNETIAREHKVEEKLRTFVDKLWQLRQKEGIRVTGPNALVEILQHKLPGYISDALVAHQLELSWETGSGLPLYEEIFHNPPAMAWRLRKALTMYRIFEDKKRIEDYTMAEVVCPPIYAKTMAWQSWYKWKYVNNCDALPELQTEIVTFPSWIDKDIHDILNSESQEECYIHGNFAVYCLVLRDSLYHENLAASKDGKGVQRETQ